MTSACLLSQPEPAGSAPPPLDPAGESSGLNEPTASGRDGATDIDDELLARIAANDESAFRQLVERHIDRAYGLAVRILNNGADAEDVVQDALLKVWTQRGRWEGGRAKFSTWLYRVVTNRCIDLRRRPRGEDVESVPEPIDEQPDAVTAMQRHEVGDMLEAAMQKLPDQQRVAVILSYHDGLSNSEIAKVMETTVAAVESLLKRGRQRLKQLLRQAEGDIRQSLAND